jgi:hypothetical protein
LIEGISCQEFSLRADIRFYVGMLFADSKRRFVIAPQWSGDVQRIKHTVSLCLDIAAERLNEISLEDIEIEQDSQERIYKALYEMALGGVLDRRRPDCDEAPAGVPCTGFWVEDTRELVLFAWSHERSKTIVIPPGDWFLREDITVH